MTFRKKCSITQKRCLNDLLTQNVKNMNDFCQSGANSLGAPKDGKVTTQMKQHHFIKKNIYSLRKCYLDGLTSMK